MLNLYVKDTNGNFPKEEQLTNRIDGVVDINDPGNIRLISTSLPEESRIEEQQGKPDEIKRTFTPNPVIHVSAVVCGERSVEASTMLKSTTLFTNRTIQFHVVAEDNLHDKLKNIFNEWQTVKSGQVMFKLYSLRFPSGENVEDWKKLFKPCAAQRLFLLDVLDSIDSVLYLDTDVLMLRPVEDLWNHFKHFDDVQLASMAPEGEETALSWYPRFARHPFFGKNGMNSGVMLMNLTRMRAFDWTEKILEAYRKYKLSITWGDQDLLNIVFHDHPGLLYTYTCDWNYRPDHCMYGNNCGPASDSGISVIHGNRGVYHNTKQPFFKAIYTTINNFKPGDDKKLLAKSLAENLHAVSDTYCGPMIESVLKFPKMFQ
ncbi:hypothetical protein ACROYT_G009809 [Oculina patagonica]